MMSSTKSDFLFILILTPKEKRADFERARTIRPFAFIEKPFKVRSLLRILKLLVEQIIAGEEDETKGKGTSFS